MHVTAERYSEIEAAFLSSVSWRRWDAVKLETESGTAVFDFFFVCLLVFDNTRTVHNIGMLAQLDVFKSRS